MCQLKLLRYRWRKVKDLSTGNAQRLGLAKALMHEPELLLLDEPTSGLDPAGIVEIRELLRNLAQNRGATVFVSSHILTEVARLASRIGIILDALHARLDRKLIVDSPNRGAALNALEAEGYKVARGCSQLELRDSRAVAHPEAVSALLAAAGHPPTHLEVKEEELEEYFLRVIGLAQGGSV